MKLDDFVTFLSACVLERGSISGCFVGHRRQVVKRPLSIVGVKVKRLQIAFVVITCLLLPLSALAQKVGGEDLTFTPKGALPVVFSHEKHVNGHGLKCSGCHYQMFQVTEGSYKMNREAITKNDFCGMCHNGLKAFGAKEEKNCARCHR